MAEITQARLKELLDYDPETGVFTWRVTRSRVKRGDIAGYNQRSKSRVYCRISVDGKNHSAHRLAFLYVHGHTPPLIDHKDNDSLNNRIENLRAATPSQNLANSRGWRSKKSSLKGAHFPKCGKWMSTIMTGGERTYLGLFPAPEAAHNAYKQAAMERSGDFARFAFP